MIKNEEEIKRWFKDHKATLTKYGDIEILDWRKTDTCIFGVRYVFDGYHMYVSGDLGEAVFRFTERARLSSLSTYSLNYFEEKMRAFRGDRRDFDTEKAKHGLDEWKKEWDEDDGKFPIEEYNDLRIIVDDCSSVKEWGHRIYDFDWDKLGYDAWEWLPEIGSVIPINVESYLLGLKMASKQLAVIA